MARKFFFVETKVILRMGAEDLIRSLVKIPGVRVKYNPSSRELKVSHPPMQRWVRKLVLGFRA